MMKMKNAILAALFLWTGLPLVAQTEFLNPDGLSKPNGYTHVVVTHPGKLIYVSGQVPLDRSGQLVGKGDFKAQATQVFENLKTALAAAGATFDDVVKINYYVRELKTADLPTLRDVRNQFVNKDHPPASTLVGVTALFREDVLLEVEAVAVVREKPKGGRR